MDDTATRPDATSRDLSRQDATGPEYEFSLTIEEAADRYASAGHPRTIRSVQRYCFNGNLDCRKISTMTGDVYRVAPYSVSRHIAQTNEVIATTGSAAGRARTRPDATDVAAKIHAGSHETSARPSNHTPRQDATGRDVTPPVAAIDDREVGLEKADLNHRYIEQLEKRIDEKDGQIGFLQDELKDRRDQFRGMKDIISEQKLLLQSMNSNMAPIFGALAGAIEKGALKAPEIAPPRVHEESAININDNSHLN